MKKVMILGAYGNFGKIISNSLSRHSTPIILAGKNIQKLTILKNQLIKKYSCSPQISQLDLNLNLKQQIQKFKPTVLINTIGPFQTNNYDVIKTAIQQKVNYLDLADGRQFIKNSKQFHQIAKQNQVSIICGASTVPGLSSAVIQQFKSQFQTIDQMMYGMSPGQKTTRGGIATIKAVLSYIGKPIKNSEKKIIYGWQNLYSQQYPQLGNRLMGNCQVPDLDLFPEQYKINKIRFSAGTQSKMLHICVWITSWLVRLGIPLNLVQHAEFLSKISHLFDVFGTDNGGMHIILKGKNKLGKKIQRKWFIIVKNGEGPNIPTIPAIIIANKLIKTEYKLFGVHACSGIISLEQYLEEMKFYNYKVYTNMKQIQ